MLIKSLIIPTRIRKAYRYCALSQVMLLEVTLVNGSRDGQQQQ